MASTAPSLAHDENWGLLEHIPLRLSVEMGSVAKTMRELLELGPGALVELDRATDDPIDILANGTVIARGEVVRAGERYGVRITEIVSAQPAVQKRERRS